MECDINGRAFNFPLPSDGIALSHDAATVYYCEISREILWSVPAAALANWSLSSEEIAKGVARRSSAEHLIATKALCCTATAWMLIVAQCSAIPQQDTPTSSLRACGTAAASPFPAGSASAAWTTCSACCG